MSDLPEETRAYELRIELCDVEPTIWRLVAVPSCITLDRLHDVIQITMGWLDYHVHLFEVDGRRFGEAHHQGGFDDEDEALVRLSEVLKAEGEQLLYTYDLGDDWHHLVTVVRIMNIPEQHTMRLRCLDGKRARPPEDVGGPPGFEHFREAMRDKDHPEHESFREWHGGAFQPNCFRIKDVNQELGKYFRWSRNRPFPWPSRVE